MKERVDKILVTLGLVETRSKAQQLISLGQVFSGKKLIVKSSEKVLKESVTVKDLFPYVGRGALKLEGAYQEFNLIFKDKVIADVGASTGGFTDYVLQHDAKKVYAIDVGHDQLALKVKNDLRVVNLEGVNIKEEYSLPEKVDLCVVDLSYISLNLVIRNIFELVKKDGQVVALFKPQFEVGKQRIGKKGIVRSQQYRLDALNFFIETIDKLKIYINDIMISPIEGRGGNVEFLLLLSQVKPKLDEVNILKKLECEDE